MSITEKLIRIQSDLKAPKSNYNDYGGYSFRSCEDIVEAVKPLLKEEGLLLKLDDNIEPIEGRFYVRAIATITDGDESISSEAYAREQESRKGMDASQITGAASSYARKYALNGLLAIDDNKDADQTNKHNKKPKKSNGVDYLQHIRNCYKSKPKVVKPIITQYLEDRGFDPSDLSNMKKLSESQQKKLFNKIDKEV